MAAALLLAFLPRIPFLIAFTCRRYVDSTSGILRGLKAEWMPNPVTTPADAEDDDDDGSIPNLLFPPPSAVVVLVLL